MPDFGPDLADILIAEGSLELAPDGDLGEALIAARDAVRTAYRIAYAKAGGDREDSIVDSLDMAENIIRDVIDHAA